ncbi:haloalkane dehalogenase [Pseudonocardia sp.]|uniref:haloalkane dehalogenase n=1 Tax=Pseudonocardia sp. TaxID=60912 RepID=UPI00261F4018|nr:haloalkane dehalogenase [Pseudonocardia sp.]
MDVLRTPDERFAELPDYPFVPHYVGIGAGDALRMHYVDEGPRSGPVVLLLHGEPTWSYLYRHTVPELVAAGLRAVVPDLVGFGRSDKPGGTADYTYQSHVDWLAEFVARVGIAGATVVGQDWGGLLGLRLVAQSPGFASSYVACNHGFPTGDMEPNDAFRSWLEYSQSVPELPVGEIVLNGCATDPGDRVRATYDAPYPDESHKAGARVFPVLVPIRPDDPASDAVRAARGVLSGWERPFLTVWGEQDAVTRGADEMFHALVPGAKGQQHVRLDAGHNLPEDAGAELGRIVADFALSVAGARR